MNPLPTISLLVEIIMKAWGYSLWIKVRRR